MGKAVKITRGFATSIAGLTAKIAKFAAVAVVALATALALLIRRQAQVIDNIGKMSDNLGISTELFIALGLAAEISGLELKDIETGMARFQKNLADAQVPLMTAVRAFDAAGVSFKELIKQSPEEAFLATVEGISKMTNQFKKMQVAQDLFGRAGKRLLVLLEGGEQGIKDFIEEARALGILLSREDVRAVEMFNDAVVRLKRALTGLIQRLTVQLAPVLEAVAKRFTSLVISSSGLGEIIVSTFEIAILTAGKFGDLLVGTRVLVLKFQAAFLNLVGAIEKGRQKLFGGDTFFQAFLDEADRTFAEAVKLGEKVKPSEVLEGFIDRIRREAAALKREIDRAVSRGSALGGVGGAPGQFKQVESFKRILFNNPIIQKESKKQAQETTQKKTVMLLERIRERLDNPQPVVIEWSRFA